MSLRNRQSLEGEYPTPQLWVHCAHRYLDTHLGEEWPQTMTVWDASCGQGSLCRHKSFKHLLLSSLHQHDVNIAGAGHDSAHPPLCAQFDFLSSMEVPSTFETALTDTSRALLFFNNPPYKTTNEQFINGNVLRPVSLTDTAVKRHMQHRGLDAGHQIAAQFIYKMIVLTELYCTNTTDGSRDAYIAVFAPTNLFSGPKYMSIVEFLRTRFQFLDGFSFDAREFDNVRGTFSVSFTLWSFRRRQNHPHIISVAPSSPVQCPFIRLHVLQRSRNARDQRIGSKRKAHHHSVSSNISASSPSSSPSSTPVELFDLERDIIDCGVHELRIVRPSQRLSVWLKQSSSSTAHPHSLHELMVNCVDESSDADAVNQFKKQWSTAMSSFTGEILSVLN